MAFAGVCMRRADGWIFAVALTVANAAVANASPLNSGPPAGVRQAQGRTASMLAFGTSMVVAAGAALAFSRWLNGSTDGTTIGITGGDTVDSHIIVTGTTTTTTGTN